MLPIAVISLKAAFSARAEPSRLLEEQAVLCPFECSCYL